MNGCFTASGMVSNGMSVKMSDYPERISISPVHRQKRDDDFYLVDRKAFPDKGVEYVRADRIEELEAKLAKAVDVELIEQAISDVLSEGGTYRDAAEYVARTTLAELKGETDE